MLAGAESWSLGTDVRIAVEIKKVVSGNTCTAVVPGFQR